MHCQIEVIVIFGPAATLLRPCLLQGGKRLCRSAGAQETAADLRAHVRPVTVFHMNQCNVGVNVGLAVCELLQGMPHGTRLPVPSACFRSRVCQRLRKSVLELCNT